jgi:hypothetical protein
MQLNKDTLIYGFAAFAAWFAWSSMKPASAASGGAAGSVFDMLTGQRKASGAAIPQNAQKVSEVLDGSGGNFSNGWRYFSDGTAIDPSGAYYLNGEKIWSPV